MCQCSGFRHQLGCWFPSSQNWCQYSRWWKPTTTILLNLTVWNSYKTSQDFRFKNSPTQRSRFFSDASPRTAPEFRCFSGFSSFFSSLDWLSSLRQASVKRHRNSFTPWDVGISCWLAWIFNVLDKEMLAWKQRMPNLHPKLSLLTLYTGWPYWDSHRIGVVIAIRFLFSYILICIFIYIYKSISTWSQKTCKTCSAGDSAYSSYQLATKVSSALDTAHVLFWEDYLCTTCIPYHGRRMNNDYHRSLIQQIWSQNKVTQVLAMDHGARRQPRRHASITIVVISSFLGLHPPVTQQEPRTEPLQKTPARQMNDWNPQQEKKFWDTNTNDRTANTSIFQPTSNLMASNLFYEELRSFNASKCFEMYQILATRPSDPGCLETIPAT